MAATLASFVFSVFPLRTQSSHQILLPPLGNSFSTVQRFSKVASPISLIGSTNGFMTLFGNVFLQPRHEVLQGAVADEYGCLGQHHPIPCLILLHVQQLDPTPNEIERLEGPNEAERASGFHSPFLPPRRPDRPDPWPGGVRPTKPLSVYFNSVKVRDRTAVVDFDRPARRYLSAPAAIKSQIEAPIRKTLTRLPEIDAVTFSIDGRALPELDADQE